MERPEDTSDHIRDFLKDRLPEPEAEAFRQRMADDPELEDRVAFARLLLGGLQEIDRRKKARRKVWRRAGWSVLAFAGLVWLYFLLRPGTPAARQPSPNAPGSTVPALDKSNADGTDAVISQGGSDSPLPGSDRAVSVAWTAQGTVIVGGIFTGQSRLGDFRLEGFGAQDIFLAEADPEAEGEFIWARQFGSPGGNDYLQKVALDSRGNILLAGGFFDQAVFAGKQFAAHGKADHGEGDFFVAQLDPTGRQLRWLDHAGGNTIPHLQTGSNLATCLAADRFDNVIAAGWYIGSPSFGDFTLPVGGPNEELFLAKYSPGGKLLWEITATCTRNIGPLDVATNARGEIFLTGFFGHHNLGGSAVFGQTTLHSFGGRDVFVAKYSAGGNLEWVRQAGSSKDQNGRDYGRGIAATPEGGSDAAVWFIGDALIGQTKLDSIGGRDIFLAKYAADGSLEWATRFGGKGNEEGVSLCLDEASNIYCTGHFSGEAQFGGRRLVSQGTEDIFVTKFSPQGKPLWAQQLGGGENQWNSDGAHDIVINRRGELVVAGFFSGSMKIGNRELVSAGREDVFLLFFDTQGNLLEAKQVRFQI